jgi:polynucleotide 5'-kinase involved in rRNA processing
MLVGVVGPCGAGKTSLVAGLLARGISVRHIAQEHSYVPDMWKRLTNPDLLIFLEVSYENTILRRKLDWTYAEYSEQLHRLRHARQHADLVLDTNPLTAGQVLDAIVSFIDSTDPKPA